MTLGRVKKRSSTSTYPTRERGCEVNLKTIISTWCFISLRPAAVDRGLEHCWRTIYNHPSDVSWPHRKLATRYRKKKAQGGQVQEGELNEELTRVRPSRDPAAAAVDGQLNTLEFQNSSKPGRRLDSCSVDGGDAVAGMTEHGTTTYYTGWRRNNNFIHSTHIELT